MSNTPQPILREYEYRILEMVEMLNDRHPVVKTLLEQGLLQYGEGGLRLTVAGSAAIGRVNSVEDQP